MVINHVLPEIKSNVVEPHPGRRQKTNQNSNENWVKRAIHFIRASHTRSFHSNIARLSMKFTFRNALLLPLATCIVWLTFPCTVSTCKRWCRFRFHGRNSANKYIEMRNTVAPRSNHSNSHSEVWQKRARELEMKLKKFPIAFPTWRYLHVVKTCGTFVGFSCVSCINGTWAGWKHKHPAQNNKKKTERKIENAHRNERLYETNRHHQQIEVHPAKLRVHITMTRCTEHRGFWTSFGKQVNLYLFFVFRLERWKQ